MIPMNRTPKTEYGLRPFSETAKWVGHPRSEKNVLQLIRKFQCSSPSKTELAVCGLGFFNASINGKPLDDCYYKPLVTDYDTRDVSKNPALLIGSQHRVCVYRYDVTELLQPGENTLEIILGNGYFQNTDRPEEPFVSYGDKKVIFELTGGVSLGSDEQTQARYLPILSGLYEGDWIDFSAQPEKLTPAVYKKAPDGKWCLPGVLADRVGETLAPVKVWQQDGIVYDFGINHSGGVAFSVRGQKGQKIQLLFAEVLQEDGTLNMNTSRWEERTDDGRLLHRIDQSGTYILSGGEDVIHPMFSWHCYRYVRVIGAELSQIRDMRSLYIHTDIPAVGTFRCSEPFFEELHRIVRRTIYNNLHAGLLTDCPHREKRSYTGDGQIIAETMLYDLDTVDFFSKWLDDLIGAQTEEGFVPYTVPYMSGGGGYGWSSAIAVIPEMLYRFTADKSFVERSYPAITKWVDYCASHAKNNIVVSACQKWLLGDWLAPEITCFNVPLMSTLWYYRSVATAAWFADILGNEQDKILYTAKKEEIARAINLTFFDQEKLCYGKGIQGENVLPLAWGIVPKQYVAPMQHAMCRHYEENGYHIDTGIIATPILLEYLMQNDMEDVAYRILIQPGYPSYRWMLEGETTVPEHWSKHWPDYFCNDNKYIKGGGDVSHCHPMFGSVMACMYKYVAGISLWRIPEKILEFAPKFTAHLQSAGGETATPYGTAGISWRMEEDVFRATVQVPPGLTGVFKCPKHLKITSVTPVTTCNLSDSQDIRLTAGEWVIEGINKE